jgi:hypothetical protein
MAGNRSASLNVLAVDFGRRIALLSNDESVLVTNFLQGADEVETVDEATMFVCGAGDTWFACRVDDYSIDAVH